MKVVRRGWILNILKIKPVGFVGGLNVGRTGGGVKNDSLAQRIRNLELLFAEVSKTEGGLGFREKKSGVWF